MQRLEYCLILHYLIVADFKSQLAESLKLHHQAHASRPQQHVWVTPRLHQAQCQAHD